MRKMIRMRTKQKKKVNIDSFLQLNSKWEEFATFSRQAHCQGEPAKMTCIRRTPTIWERFGRKSLRDPTVDTVHRCFLPFVCYQILNPPDNAFDVRLSDFEPPVRRGLKIERAQDNVFKHAEESPCAAARDLWGVRGRRFANNLLNSDNNEIDLAHFVES